MRVIQRFELAEDSDVDRGTEGLLHFIEGDDLVAQQKRAQFIGAVGEGPHNVIVPITAVLPDRNYNKSKRRWLPLQKSMSCCPYGVREALLIFENQSCGEQL